MRNDMTTTAVAPPWEDAEKAQAANLAAWEDENAARRNIEHLIYDFGEAMGAVGFQRWEAENGSEDECPEGTTSAARAEVFRHLLPALREFLSKWRPDLWADFLAAEATETKYKAEEEARRLAEAKAAGFESYKAMREAERKARRSAAAKKAAETRARYRGLGLDKKSRERRMRQRETVQGIMANALAGAEIGE